MVTFAQTNGNLSTLITMLIGLLNQALVLLMAIAVVMFVWYVIQYFIKPNSDRKDANTYILYSVIGFFVILSIWGIVNILSNTFGVGNAANQPRSWADFSNIFPR